MKGEHHPAPHRDQLSGWTASVLLYTGPLAWLLQICVGEMMTSWPCFPDSDRRDAPIAGYEWTWTAAIIVLALCAAAACTTGVLAWRKFRDVREEREGGHESLLEIGHGRTRFVALWGAYLGLGFAVATLLTLTAFALVPPCLG
ncbi:MAG: hypothetical protein JF608_14660 [Sphingomonadales bacterium]|jgi:hypothetical protein|nr:hypothetical protein [Sphingomonadales bacterium]